MKKHFINFVKAKKYQVAILTSIVLLAGSLNAGATEKTDTTKVAFVEYHGLKGNLTSFAVHFENTYAKKFELCLEDENGEILYSKIFTANYLDKQILLKNVGDNYRYKVNFIIRAGKEKFEQVFDINTKSTLMKDMVVTRL